MSTKLFGLVVAGTLLVSGSAFADEFYFQSAGSVVWNGVYVNPYQALNNTQPADNPLTIYCDDWNTDFSGNPTWNAKVYQLVPSEASNFRYGNTTPNYNVNLEPGNKLSVSLSAAPAPFDRYLEAAWLDNQWRLAIGTPAATNTLQIGLATAMWTLFVDPTHVGDPHLDGSIPTDGLIGAINATGYATDVYNYLQAAQNAIKPVSDGGQGYTAEGWDVIVPEGNSFPMQEFLVYGFNGHTTAPEPSAVILLGTIVAYLGFRKIRQRRTA